MASAKDDHQPPAPEKPKAPRKTATSASMPPVPKTPLQLKKSVPPPPPPKQAAAPQQPTVPAPKPAAAPQQPSAPAPKPAAAPQQPATPAPKQAATPQQPPAPAPSGEKKAAALKGATAPKAAKPAGKDEAPAKDAKKEEGALDAQVLREVTDMLRLQGMVINNASLYGPSHRITLKSLDDSFKFLIQLLGKISRINLSVADGEILAEGKPIGMRNPFVNIFAARLAEIEISGFTLIEGMSKEEFYKLMELLLTATGPMGEEDGFAEAVEQRGLEHIHAERVKYERITEGDTVVEKTDKDKMDTLAAMGGNVEQIMAFLKGDVTAKAEGVGEGLAATAEADAEHLAGMIMEASAVRQRSGDFAEGESLGDIVVGCLRRTFDGLMAGPAGKSKKGRKTIKKTLLVLEKTVLDRLHQMSGDSDPRADAAIHEAVEEMTDDLEIDALTAEYMKKRKALEQSEKRVLKYIKTHEENSTLEVEMQDKLAEAGITPGGWQELLVKSGVTAGSDDPSSGGGAGRAIAGAGVLAVLLSELDEMMTAQADSKSLGEKVGQLGQKVNEIAAGTEKKIDEFDSRMKEDEQAVEGVEGEKKKKLRMSRTQLMELLAEIVQELCQSLSAINCAVGMTLAGHIGDINTEQREVLGVASNCTHRLDQLLDRLFEIVGLPKGLAPDKDMVYKKSSG